MADDCGVTDAAVEAAAEVIWDWEPKNTTHYQIARAALTAVLPHLVAERDAEIERLREDCAEFYQVIGCLADMAGVFDTDPANKALDNALAASSGMPRPHADLLPYYFPSDPLETWRQVAEKAVAEVAEKDARIRVLEGQVTEFAQASSSLLKRYNLYDMPEDDSRRWQQLSDAILRSDVARTALEKPHG